MQCPAVIQDAKGQGKFVCQKQTHINGATGPHELPPNAVGVEGWHVPREAKGCP